MNEGTKPAKPDEKDDSPDAELLERADDPATEDPADPANTEVR